MQTKKRAAPPDCIVDAMYNPQNAIAVPSKKPKNVHPSEYVRVNSGIPTQKGFITFEREIGKGSFSKCYYGHIRPAKQVFAVKVQYIKECSTSSRQRMEREIAIHHSLSTHKAITTFFGSYKDRSNLYIQLELCANGDLNSYIKKHGTISPERSWKMIRSICSGLEYIHAGRIIHRDIKMANIFLTASMEPKIGDFGLACVLPLGESRKFSKAGTPAYMAPELCLAPHVCSTASDIWALGILWYSCVYGVLPFMGATSEEIAKLVAKGTFKFPDYPQSPLEFRKLIKVVLSSRSGLRPSANSLVKLLSKSPFDITNKPPRIAVVAAERASTRAALEAENMGPPHHHQYSPTTSTTHKKRNHHLDTAEPMPQLEYTRSPYSNMAPDACAYNNKINENHKEGEKYQVLVPGTRLPNPYLPALPKKPKSSSPATVAGALNKDEVCSPRRVNGRHKALLPEAVFPQSPRSARSLLSPYKV